MSNVGATISRYTIKVIMRVMDQWIFVFSLFGSLFEYFLVFKQAVKSLLRERKARIDKVECMNDFTVFMSCSDPHLAAIVSHRAWKIGADS